MICAQLQTKLSIRTFFPFGLSPLYSWIRFFECIIHISYRLDIKSWQTRDPEMKRIVAKKKKKRNRRKMILEESLVYLLTFQDSKQEA